MTSTMAETSTDTSDKLRIIRALLAQAEATSFPAEAETFMEKVSTLIARWGVDEALVWADADPEKRGTPVDKNIQVEAPYAARKALLVNAVADACGVRAVRILSGSKVEIITLIGFAGDVERAEMLITSLLIQMTQAILAETPRGASAQQTASWRRSFITGYANRIWERLTKDRSDAARSDSDEAADTSTVVDTPRSSSTALVLADRDEAVNAAVKEKFPRLRTTYMRAGRSATGSAAGRSAADRASLGEGRLGGPAGALGR